ncbi:MAG: hypothetical protein A4E28_01192 [Methanocella sp. PtaU1.Bin125]|nr:MAG: hypothetical protein A4E28_01192 [Methanocella sp. PtaU1.Bin125]
MDLSKDLKYDYTYRPYDHNLYQASRGPIDDILSPGEKVLWSGQPSRKLLVFRREDLFMLPFALFWTGFSLFWELGALSAVSGPDGLNPVALCFPLFGVPFVAIGLYMLFGRFVVEFLARRRTWYALTDRRVVVLTALRDRNVASMPLEKIGRVDITIYRSGRGTLIFEGDSGTGGDGRRSRYAVNSVMAYSGEPVFDRIEDPKRVYDMVLEAQEDRWAYQRHRSAGTT